MQNTSLFSRTGVIALLASSLFVVGCADKRGFQTKRLAAPFSTNQDTKPQPTPEIEDGSLANLGRILNAQETRRETDLVVESQIVQPAPAQKQAGEEQSLEGNQIIYREGGVETPVTAEKIEELKETLFQTTQATSQLSPEMQFLKGVSIVRLAGASSTQLPIQVTGVVELNDKNEVFKSNVTLNLDEAKKALSGSSRELVWESGSQILPGEVFANCAGVEQDPCSQVSVTIQLGQAETLQSVTTIFIQEEDGYSVYKSSISIASVEDVLKAQVAEDVSAEESPADETESAEAQSTETPVVEEKPATQVVEKVSSKPVVNEQKRISELRLKHQADQASMKALSQSSVTQSTAPAPTAVATAPKANQKQEQLRAKHNAESASMKALKESQAAAKVKAQKEVIRNAEAASMKALKESTAPKAQSQAQIFRAADQASMKALKESQAAAKVKAQKEVIRNAEAASMKALKESQAAAKVKAQKEMIRNAEAASMKALKNSQATQN